MVDFRGFCELHVVGTEGRCQTAKLQGKNFEPQFEVMYNNTWASKSCEIFNLYNTVGSLNQ